MLSFDVRTPCCFFDLISVANASSITKGISSVGSKPLKCSAYIASNLFNLSAFLPDAKSLQYLIIKPLNKLSLKNPKCSGDL